MASRPFLDKRRKCWVCKYKPSPDGPWVRVILCKHPEPYPPSKPPRKPPQLALERAAEFAEIEYRAKHGLQPAPQRETELAAYLARYIETFEASHDQGSTRQLRRHARNFQSFCEARGVHQVQSVARAHCRDYLEARVKKVSPSSLVTERGYLRPIWTRAVDDGLVAANPWSGVKVPGTVVHRPPTFWTSEQIKMIAEACSKAWQRDLVLVLANTGLRICAALAIEWNWIDWDQGTIVVPRESSKSGKPYTVAMTRLAQEVLRRRYDALPTWLTRRPNAVGRSLVFPNPKTDGLFSYDCARAAIGKAIKQAGVPQGTIHSLRHSYGRALALAGVPLVVIRSQLGHASLSQTQRYIDVTEAEAARFVADWGLGE